MITYNTLVVLVGVGLLGAGAGLIGTFAVLRRFSLLGDALAHAALPGLCLAFLVLEVRSLPVLLSGALASGLAGILVVAGLRRWTRIKEDAALGIVLSVFFGAGVVLSRLIQNRSTAGSKAGLDSYILGKTAGMLLQDVYLIGGLALLALVIVVLLFKEFQLTSFDPGFARVQGWPTLLLDLLLMFLIALAVVIGLPAVGVVMVAALIILPGAAARFWTDRLSTMLVLSAVIGLATGAGGALVSAAVSEMPAGPVIALVGAGLFALSAVVAPRRGLVGRWLVHRRHSRNLDEAWVFRLLHELTQGDRKPVLLSALYGRTDSRAGGVRGVLLGAQQRGEVRFDWAEGLVELSPAGIRRAAEMDRQYRLWTLFLLEYPGLASLTMPLDGSRVEDHLPAEIVESLTVKLAEGRPVAEVSGS